MFTLTGHSRAVRALAYCPRTGVLASAGDDRAIRLWRPLDREPLPGIEPFRDGLLALAFSPDGWRLAAGGRGGSLVVWDVESRRPLLAHGLGGPVVCAEFSRDGQAVLGGLQSVTYDDEPGRLLCLNLQPPDAVVRLPFAGEVEHAAFAPGRDVYAVAGQHRGVELWEVLRPRREPFAWLPARVGAMAFSPGAGRWLACASGRVVMLFDLDEPGRQVRCVGHRSVIGALAFRYDGLQLLTGGLDGTVRLWETLSGKELASWNWQIGAVHAVAFAPDGMTAAAAGHRPTVVIWDVDE